MSTTTELATQSAAFRVTTKSRVARMGPQLLLAGIFGFIGLGLLSTGISRPETNTLTPGALCFLGGLATAAYAFLAPLPGVRAIELGTDGFAWEDGTGQHRADWDQIIAARRSPKVIISGFVRSASTTLDLVDGRKVLLDFALEGYDRLADLVQRMRAAQVLPGLRAELETGRPVGFGPVSVDPTGIEFQGLDRPWGAFAYAFDSGCLVMVPAGESFGWDDRTAIQLTTLPDAAALAEVLAQFQSPIDPFLTIPRRDREKLARG